MDIQPQIPLEKLKGFLKFNEPQRDTNKNEKENVGMVLTRRKNDWEV